MAVIAMKQLLEAGVHFGHQTRRWDPKMAEYIFENKRLSLQTPVVAIADKKHLAEDLKMLLSKEDAAVALKYCRQKEIKTNDFVSFDTPVHKVVVGVVETSKHDFTLTGGKIYRYIKNEQNAAVLLPKRLKKEAAYEMAQIGRAHV